LRPLIAETVVTPTLADVPDGDGWAAVGTGFAAADAALQIRLHGRLGRVDATALPHAAAVAHLGAAAFARGEGLPAERVEPAYLRDNVALTLEQQQALRAKR
jgi:tRNA threonylcarbamoyladenosine biosynthesis protein TsaB